MTLALSGSAAAFLAKQVQPDGRIAYVVTALPTSFDLELDREETLPGYSNSPHVSTALLTYAALSLAPNYGFVPVPDSRVVSITRAMTTGPVWPAPFDPSDNAPYVFDLSNFLGAGSALDTLASVTVSATGAALGVLIDSGSHRPVVDRQNKRISIWPKVDPTKQGPTSFATAVAVSIAIRFTTVAAPGVPAETYERAARLTIGQFT